MNIEKRARRGPATSIAKIALGGNDFLMDSYRWKDVNPEIRHFSHAFSPEFNDVKIVSNHNRHFLYTFTNHRIKTLGWSGE